jgi:hypothetical protein
MDMKTKKLAPTEISTWTQAQHDLIVSYFDEMGPYIYEDILPLMATLEKSESLPECTRKEVSRVGRFLRKRWEYVAENINTIDLDTK